MATTNTGGRWLRPAFLVLPLIYVGTIGLTYALSVRTPGGAYYRIWGSDPLAAVVGMGYDSEALIVAVFLLSGIPWWYFIGRIGWQIRGRSMSRWSLGVGAIVALFTFLVCSSMTARVIQADLQERSLTNMALLQYALIASLCLGALVSAVCAVIATSRQVVR